MRHGAWTFGIAILVGAGCFSACSKDEEEPKGGGLGASCDPTDADSCGEDLTCSTGPDDASVCAYAAGTTCDPDRDNGGCAHGLECLENEAGETTCVVPTGDVCDPGIDNGGCATTDECLVPEPLVLMPPPDGGAGGATGAGGAGNADADPRCLTLEGEECDPTEEHCTNGLVCAEMDAGGNRCFPPVVLRGTVTDTTDASPIDEAHVIAIDDEGVAVSDVAVTGEDGTYALPIPVARHDDGSPVDATFTLRSGAQDYQPFPSGIRVALPISTTEAGSEDVGYVIDNALTDVGLIPLPDGDRYWITGSIAGLTDESEIGGVLVLAVGDGDAYSAVTDKSGNYTIFNVPDGSYEIQGYAAGLQIESSSVTVSGEAILDTSLTELDQGTTTVEGNIQIVNAPGGSVTSVILVVEATFDPNAARGEVPRGLRAPRTGAPDVDGDFSIEGVPDGTYVVLAAWENDDLVRDPDSNIAGTDFVTIEVEGGTGTYTIPDSFKVTEALELFGPGAEQPEAVDGPPTLRWADDSSEEWYEVRVFDAFGDEVWSVLDVPGASGVDEVTLDYEGPLDPGMYYQFRVTSWRAPGGGDPSAISATEDLRGVFYLPAP
jgi:hypothetical protein